MSVSSQPILWRVKLRMTTVVVMGLRLEYTCGEQSFVWQLSQLDIDVFIEMSSHLKSPIDLLLDVPGFGNPTMVEAAALRSAALEVLAFLEANPDKLPRVYQASFEGGTFDTGGSYDTGGFSGIRLANDPDHAYALWVGLNTCRLEKRRLDGSATLQPLEVRDLRNSTVLETENLGVVRFRSRRAKTTIKPRLREVLSFLDRSSGHAIRKILG